MNNNDYQAEDFLMNPFQDDFDQQNANQRQSNQSSNRVN